MTFALIHILRMVIIMVRLQVALLKAATPDTTDLSFIEIDRTIDDTELFFQLFVWFLVVIGISSLVWLVLWLLSEILDW
jgi:hypothetical protein